MVQVSRRLFLFGAAATVAAASVPPALAKLVEPVAAPYHHVFLKRRIGDMTIAFEPTVFDEFGTPVWPNVPMTVRLLRQGHELPMFHVQSHARGIYRWIAPPADEDGIWSTPTSLVMLDIDCPTMKPTIQLFCRDWIDDGPPVDIVELHGFTSATNPVPMFLHVDNSLEARLAREEARKRNWGEDVPEPEDDEVYDPDETDRQIDEIVNQSLWQRLFS